jgi:N-acetylglucosamine malate deacetylase 1
MNILAIGAHPDDVEEGCAGTLAKFAGQGHKIFMATATNGNVGSTTHSKDEIARIRKAEAARSAALIGAEYICLDYDDEMFFESREARLKFIDLVRYCQADLVLTHYYRDYLPDHELTSKIINDIAVMIPVDHIETPHPPYKKIPQIYYYEPALGIGFLPTEYVDITNQMDQKLAMLSCHESQIQWLKDNLQDKKDNAPGLTRMATITAQYRGMQCGVDYAEAFIRALNANRITPERLLP